jgi:hypothetical protein
MIYYIMAAQQDKIEQNVERRQLEVKADDIRTSHGEPWYFFRSYVGTNHGQNWAWWQLGQYITPDSYVFVSLTEVDPNTKEPRAHGTVKYYVSSVSPRHDFLDLKFEAFNGAEGILTRTDFLIYTSGIVH